MNWQQRFGRVGLALLLAALSAVSALAQPPAQRGRGGGGPTPGAPATSGLRGGGSGAQIGSGGVPSSGRRGGSRIEKVSDAVEQLYKQLDEKSLQEVPRREIAVARSTEKVGTKLFRADPKLLENKFIAAFTLLPAGLDPSDEKSVEQTQQRIVNDNDMRSSLQPPLAELVRWNGRGLFQPYFRTRAESDAFSLQNYFKLLAENCPAADRPETAFLTSADVDRDVERTPTTVLRKTGEQVVSMPGLQAWTFIVYAPTAEEAEVRARAILRLLDGGLSRPMQRFLLEQGRGQLAAARQAQADVATATEAVRVETEKLAKPSEISPDILSQLKAQKVMVAVELAGLMARVKACDGMLKDPKRLEISTLQSISDMKVKAEIEFVGIKEKLDQINAFIGEGNDREAAASRLNEASIAKARAQSLLSRYNGEAETFGQLVLLYAPLQIEGNQIKIAPIEWTN